ncbi:MAG: hypothetical protein ABIQ59_02325 [Nocardioidaceae bacterium]
MPVSSYAAEHHPEVRVVEERFVPIERAVGTSVERSPEAVAFLRPPKPSSGSPAGRSVRETAGMRYRRRR